MPEGSGFLRYFSVNFSHLTISGMFMKFRITFMREEMVSRLRAFGIRPWVTHSRLGMMMATTQLISAVLANCDSNSLIINDI